MARIINRGSYIDEVPQEIYNQLRLLLTRLTGEHRWKKLVIYRDKASQNANYTRIQFKVETTKKKPIKNSRLVRTVKGPTEYHNLFRVKDDGNIFLNRKRTAYGNLLTCDIDELAEDLNNEEIFPI